MAFSSFITPLTPHNTEARRCQVSRESASHRILIMRLAAHGDILMATPLLSALREAWPECHLTWIAGQDARGAIEAHPLIDEILIWPTDYWTKRARKGGALFQALWRWETRALRRALRSRAYDFFISLQPEEWPGLAAETAPVSVGVFDTFRQFHQTDSSSRFTRCYTHAFTHSDLPEHRIDQYLLPLTALGLPGANDKRMQMGVTAEDDLAAADFLRHQGLTPGQPFVTLAPMTTWPSRCWPAERFAALGNALTSRGYKVVLIGSAQPQEQESLAKIAWQMAARPIVAAGALPFRQMAALISRSALLVSGDTGPMHVAAAVDTPFVALFGPTPVAARAPLAGRGLALMHPVPCGPCDQKVCPNSGEDHMLCLKLLTVEEVLEAADTLLQNIAAVGRDI